ncbi:MAG: glycosyltransferase family 39 protein [Patescibacteria group bacterium]|nr:glycosyltransferase family 39 protein [Patescibacteria group bacterium]
MKGLKNKNYIFYIFKIIKKNKEKIFLVLVFLLAFFLRVFKLDNIPAEIWGDVNEHIIYTKEILSGKLYWDFFGGDGPVFDYLTALFFLIFGKNFLAIKITTVFIGMLILYFAYLILKKITQKKFIQLTTIFLMTSSFWLVSFSRQAKPYILVLLFVEFFIYFFLNKKYFLSGIILGIGLFVQSSFWGMIFFAFLNWKIFLSFSPFFLLIFLHQLYPQIILSSTSYLGEKTGYYLSFNQKIYNFFENIFDNLQSIFLKGDIVFRHNIPNRPILDVFLSLFFIFGLIIFLREMFTIKNKLKINLFLISVFIFSQFASFLDITNPLNSPSFGRMIGAGFFIYYICSLGLSGFYYKLRQINLKFTNIFIFFIFTFIFFKNFYDYFFIYPKTLPNNNIPYGKIITDDIKKENKKIIKIVYGCCWGEWGQPEPKSILNYLEKENIKYFDFFEKNELCNFVKNQKQDVLIYTQKNINIDCLDNFKIERIEKDFYQKNLIKRLILF